MKTFNEYLIEGKLIKFPTSKFKTFKDRRKITKEEFQLFVNDMNDLLKSHKLATNKEILSIFYNDTFSMNGGNNENI